MRNATALIIEDDADIAKVNAEYLEGLGFRAVIADTLDQARFFIEDPVDIILLDVLLPDGDGFSFCEEIRGRVAAPILFLTCKDDNISVLQGFMKGGDDYLTKPYDINVLGARVKALLKRADITSGGVIETPPLRVDILAGTVTLDGESILMTPKEIQILSYLMLNIGKKVSVQALKERLGMGNDPGAVRTLAVHIANIRKKLTADATSCFSISGAKDGSYIFSRVKY
ncbi:MAG: response regulator transcription factor [Clostridiales bacterium]|jgi:DNA-binding response OmpR family regulator|nr:response regulator transcription factor [Clostridiales bacterium]